MNTSYSLISAVREGKLEIVRELIDSFGLSYSQAWSKGYVLLRNAIENKHTEVAKLLLINGSKVNSKNKKPSNTPLHFAVINGNIEIVEIILGRGANVDAKNKYNETPLHLASKNENREIVKLLLSKRANVNARDSSGMTSLHIATGKGYSLIVEDLLKYGACVDSASTSTWREGFTPLHLAAEKGNEEIIKLFLSKGFAVNANDEDNLTPLYIATENGHENVVKLLLDHGANVDTQDINGKTVLHFAVEKGYLTIIEHILKYCPDVNNRSNRNSLNAAVHGYREVYRKIVESLLQYGLTVNLEDISNFKLLNTAVEKGYLKIVKDFLKFGGDVNMFSTSKKGYTLLHSAAKSKQEEVAKLLVNFRADVNAKDETGKTPIFYATENTDLKITKLLLTNGASVKNCPDLLNTAVKKECREIVEILLQHDADIDINAIDKYGRTALHFTTFSKDGGFFGALNKNPDINVKGEITSILLSRGANANAQTKNGITTLHAAAKKGYEKVVEALLEYNADVNTVVINDITPLHLSAQEGNAKICKMLLNKGANVNAKQKNGITALHIATQKGNKRVVELLLKCGANVDFRDKKDITLLHVAAQKGYLEIVEILLKFGADVNSCDEYGRTALHVASQGGRTQVVMLLLKHGSNINIMSQNNRTPLDSAKVGINSFYGQIYEQRNNYDSDNDYYDLDSVICTCEEIAEILKKHIVKMKVANLYVSEKNLLSISINELSDFQNECEEEIESMKRVKIGNNNVSFHDILTKDINQLAIYARNENIAQVLKSDDYKTVFPIYACMIDSQFRKGIERKELLEQGNKFFDYFFNSFPKLPHECTEKISCYLCDRDLRNLIHACKPTNVTSLNTDISHVATTSVVKSRNV